MMATLIVVTFIMVTMVTFIPSCFQQICVCCHSVKGLAFPWQQNSFFFLSACFCLEKAQFLDLFLLLLLLLLVPDAWPSLFLWIVQTLGRLCLF